MAKTTPETTRLIEAVFSRMMFENEPRAIVNVSHVRETKTGYSARVMLRHKMHQQKYIGRLNSKTGKVRITRAGEVEPRTAWK